jgi:hypothetical protein
MRECFLLSNHEKKASFLSAAFFVSSIDFIFNFEKSRNFVSSTAMRVLVPDSFFKIMQNKFIEKKGAWTSRDGLVPKYDRSYSLYTQLSGALQFF